MKIPTTALALLLATSLPAFAQSEPPIPLWPEGVPGEAGLQLPAETREDRDNDGIVRVSNVSEPTLAWHPAPAASNTGTTVLVCPGGGYSILAIAHEGDQVAEWLNGLGVNAAVLKYRVPRRKGREKHAAPLEDARRALAMIRDRADEWAIDPGRVGILGFSAGGHLGAVALAGEGEEGEPGTRPDFGILVYPAYLQSEENPDRLAPEFAVEKDTPPVFLVVAHDDRRFAPGNALFYLALARAKVPAELHVFARGGHGFGMKDIDEEVRNWPVLAGNWMRAMGFLGE